MNKAKALLGLLGLAIAACTTLPHGSHEMRRGPAYAYAEYGANTSFPEDQKLTFSKFRDLIVNGHVTDVTQALPVLAAKYKNYMYYHTLMYASFSIQESSFDQPRAIVYGPESRFIFTFNGDKSQAGGNEFETVEFDGVQKKFLFREIIFKDSKFNLSDVNLETDEVDFQNQTILISKANPQKCLQCHGQNASPVWQSYFNWPGAYGSNDDQLGMSFDKGSWNANNSTFFEAQNKPTSVGRSFVVKPGSTDTELEGFIRYAKAKPTHPRYRWLPKMPIEVAAVRYDQSKDWASADVSSASKDLRQKLNETAGDWPARPNLVLLERLSALNMIRIAARLTQAGIAENSLKSPLWDGLAKMTYAMKNPAAAENNPVLDNLGYNTIPDVTAAIENVLMGLPFKHARPSRAQIQMELIKNLRDEFANQQEKMTTESFNFGAGILVAGHPDRGPDARMGFEWIGSSSSFYRQLMPLTTISETDRMAFTLEANDQVLMTAIDLYLLDRGVDLRDYDMNLRQQSLNFHDYLDPAITNYLGVTAYTY